MTWADTIKAAKERGKFTYEERKLAMKWETCATSERQVECYKGTSIPVDPVIANLGNQFALALDHKDIKMAEEVLDRIESRTKPKVT